MANTRRNLRDGALAIMVVSCMLFCAFTPAIINWNEGDVFASEPSDDDTFRYVSLGDSMTNAYGSLDYYYYDDELEYYQTCLGFLQDDTFSYTVQFAKVLSEQYGDDFEFMQMATGGFRSEELRALLYDDYTQDFLNGKNDLDSRIDRALRSPDIRDDNVTNRAEFENYLRSNLVDADLITYQYLYDVGTAISKPLLNMVEGKPAPEYDFSKYLGDEVLEIGEYVYSYVYDLILSNLGGSIAGIDPSLIDVALSVAEGAAYGVVAYCANFDANMSWLYEVGHDGKVFEGNVIVIDSYDNYGDVVFKFGDFSIPFGEILGTVFDIVNVYTKYLSKWSTVTYHVAVNEDPAMMYDEFVIGEEPSDDSKAVFFQSIFNLTRPDKCAETDALVGYLSQICKVPASEIVQNNYNNNMSLFVEDFARIYTELDYGKDLTEFLSYAFDSTEIDFMGVLGCIGDADKIVTKLITFLIYLRTAYETPGLEVEMTYDEGDGCTAGFNVEVPGASDITFSPTEMSFVFIAMNLMAGDNPMSHPSEDGHDYLLSCILDASEPFDPSFIIDAIGESEYLEGAEDLIFAFLNECTHSFLDVTKGDVVELTDALTDLFVPFVLDILVYDAEQEVPQIMGTKYEYLVSTGTLLAAHFAETVVDSIVLNLSVYDGDVLDLRFNPLEDYNSRYFGGVFSMFDDDPTNNILGKTLMDLISGMTPADIASLKDVDLVHIAPTSGSMMSIIFEIVTIYEDFTEDGELRDYEPCDYGTLSSIIGEDITDMANAFRDQIAVMLSEYLSDSVDENVSKMISIIIDRVAYTYIGSLVSTVGIVGMVEDTNPDASFLVYSAYNELRGVDLDLYGNIIPIGDYLDKVFALYNIFIYQFCELKDNVAYVDISTATTALCGEPYGSIEELAGYLLLSIAYIPDEQVFIDGAADWIVTDNARYEITWMTFEGTFVDIVDHGVVPEYNGELVPEGGETYVYEFAGWDREVVEATGPATYIAQYNIVPNVSSDNGSVVFDVEAFDQIETAIIITDGWSMEISSAIFDGLEGEVEIRVDVVDVSEIPTECRIYAGNKKVILLDMTVGGTEVTDFGENLVTVTFKYVPDAGEKMDDISVFWINEANGTLVEYPATYDADTGEITFDTNHFSYWFVGERTSESDMSDVMPYIAVFLIIIALICVVYLRMKR